MAVLLSVMMSWHRDQDDKKQQMHFVVNFEYISKVLN
jgi:hypothetical protein